MKTTILVVDDEEHVRDLVSSVLKDGDHQVVEAKDGQEGLKAFFEHQPNLVILDIMMPKMDGWMLLERIREVSQAPVIILSARAQESDAVRGIRNGADDYVIKPTRLGELTARVESLLRKVKDRDDVHDEYRDAVLHVDFRRHLIYLKGDRLELTAQEFRLLSALVRNAGAVLSANRLIDICWGDVGGPEHVRVYVGYLRKKLEENPARPQLIETIREFGYRYCPPTQSD